MATIQYLIARPVFARLIVAIAFLSSPAVVLAEDTATRAATPISLVSGHSFVLLDTATQCRYIGKVELASALKVPADNIHSEWVMKVEEKWCRPKSFQPERAVDFHGAILELVKAQVPGDLIVIPGAH